jgi:hypothetical protein
MWHHKKSPDALPNSIISNIDQVCIVTRDFEASIELISSVLGIGPFKCWTIQPPELFGTTFRGKPAPWSMKLGVALVGGMQFEVIQPLDENNLYAEHLMAQGPSVHHLLLETKGVSHPDSVTYFEKQGFEHAQTAMLNLPLLVGGVTFPAAPQFLAKPLSTHLGYIDSFAKLGTTLELSQFPPGISRPLGIRIGKANYMKPDAATDVTSRLPNSVFDKVSKLGFVVKDAEATAKAWATYAGVGPWHMAEFGAEALSQVSFAGEFKGDFRARVAWALVGTTLFELIQPLEGDTPHSRMLKAKGDGLRTISMTTDMLEFEDASKDLEARGLPLMLKGVLHGGQEFALFNAEKQAHTWIELVRLAGPALFEELKKIPGKKIT